MKKYYTPSTKAPRRSLSRAGIVQLRAHLRRVGVFLVARTLSAHALAEIPSHEYEITATPVPVQRGEDTRWAIMLIQTLAEAISICPVFPRYGVTLICSQGGNCPGGSPLFPFYSIPFLSCKRARAPFHFINVPPARFSRAKKEVRRPLFRLIKGLILTFLTYPTLSTRNFLAKLTLGLYAKSFTAEHNFMTNYTACCSPLKDGRINYYYEMRVLMRLLLLYSLRQLRFHELSFLINKRDVC